ncbi:MAG: BatD family protein [Bacteroidetes bacterium]|nr:BatD family protein [Bacteroidota bacterium]MDA0922368.1 BatD family protein [Bacteroidota bacterium]MDA1288260.1 BatD family protein [Bacteroidota bacterium]
MHLKIAMRFLWSILFMFSIHLQAQITFEAKVSKKRLGLNERLRVDFEMNENGDNFNPPSFTNFQVVSGPQQSVSRSWINGVRSFSKTYTYFLTPLTKGKVTLGQAEITIEGEVYKTLPVEIEVTEAVEQPNDPNNIDYITDENIRLVAEISDANPYLNEGITVVYKLYFRNPISISDVQEMESPTFGDFWSQMINIGRVQVNPRGNYNGEQFNEVVWRKVVLYPQKTGPLEIEPLTLNLSLSVPTNQRDLFGRQIPVQAQKVITTGKKRINVRTLPLTDQPAEFSGAVGQFDFDVILDKSALKASESFQVKVKVNGNGNLKLFNLPRINVPKTLEVYEPEHKEEVKVTLSGMQGSVEDVYTIVPQFQGKYPIPTLEFSYFDPEAATYKTLRSQDLLVDVFDGPVAMGSQGTPSAQLPKQNLQVPESAFRFIQLQTQLVPIAAPEFWWSVPFWLLLGIPFVLLIAGYFINQFIVQKPENISLTKQRRAEQLSKKYLSSAKKAIHNQTAFYEALERALHNYLKAKLKIETTEMSKPNIKKLLVEKKVQEQAAQEFIESIENCERARYAPGSMVNIQSDFEKASTSIASLDRQL